MRVFYSIFVEDSLRYIIRMFPGFLLAVLMFLALRPWRVRRLAGQGLSSSLLREAALLLFWLFCGGMAVLTLTPGWFDWLPLLQGLKPVHGPFFSLGSWNLAPGRCFEGGLWQSYMLLGNIIMFVPFGFFSALLWRGYNWKRALLTGVCITAFIECWQLCVGRAFDIDDIILNTLGVFCGYLLWKLPKKYAPRLARRFQVMDILELVTPTMEYKDQVMAFKAEMLEYGSDFEGCSGLENTETYEEWLDFRGREKRKGWLPSHTYLTVRRSDGRVVGIINYRPSPLSDFVLQYGGHIGYSIRLSERRKGYAKEQLRLTLEKCRAAGEDRVLLTCDHQGNPGSEKTILANGGVLEKEVEDTPGLGNFGRIRRYWITL